MNWQYDEMRQVGTDFENADQVAQYDSKRRASREAEQQLVHRLRIVPGRIVVDLGCGTGSFARAAALSGAHVRAVDVSQPMLDFLQAAAAREGAGDIQTEHAGFLTFNALPNSIDVVVSRFALHHLPDFWKQVALRRIQNALRRDGLLYLRDVVFSFSVDEYEKAVEDWVHRMPQESGFCREEFETHIREEYSTFSWILEGFLERAGFEILEKEYPAQEYAEYMCRPLK